MESSFFLTRQNQLRTVCLKLVLDDETLTFRTPLKIKKDDWDAEKQRPKNIYLKEFKELNNKLDTIKVEVYSAFAYKKPVSKRTIARRIEAVCKEVKTVFPEKSLLYYIELYILSRKELVCSSTLKRYKVFKRLLKRFEGFAAKRWMIEDLNMEFVNDFLFFGKEEEYSENTIYRTIHFVKTILNFAERKGIRTCVRELEVRREKQSKQVITLTESEIAQIEQTEVPKHLQAAKDWLLISCFTGQRFSDFMHFDSQKLNLIKGKSCLLFVQQKTKKEILLPLHPTVLNTLKRNENHFPKLMDIQRYNHDIKEIARLAKLNEAIKAKKRSGFRTKEVNAEKWEILSSHIGRRSFATNFYGKIPTPLLMEATGHSTEQMFLRYINPSNDERILALGDYFDKVYGERMAV